MEALLCPSKMISLAFRMSSSCSALAFWNMTFLVASSPASGITSDLAKLLPKADVKKVLLIHTADASNPEAALKGWLSREGFNK